MSTLNPGPLPYSMNKLSRRDAIKAAGASTGASVLASMTSCERSMPNSGSTSGTSSGGGSKSFANEEYVWLSANANLPLFAAHDHPALRLVGEDLGIKVTVAGPNSVDIPGLVAAIEQTTARRPAGMMVVGWDP